MSSRTALVVTFDRLPASILGCYGNEWIETPHIDRLAAGGLVCDHCWSAHVGPASAETAFAAETCLTRLKSARIRTSLFREESAQIAFAETDWASTAAVTGELGPSAKPDRIPLAESVRAAQAAWNQESAGDRSHLFWLHARGLEIPAEPPQGFADLYLDEFEDRGVTFEKLPDAERKCHPLVAAGMMSLFDHWLGQLFAGLAETDRPRLTIVAAAQGALWQPLPNSFGPLDALRSQISHVPLIVHVAGAQDESFPAGLRTAGPCSTRSLGPLLAWWFGGGDRRSWSAAISHQTGESIVTTSSAGGTRITTAAWAAIFPPSAAEIKQLLFRKPEDFWEVNNLAEISADVIDELRSSAIDQSKP